MDDKDTAEDPMISCRDVRDAIFCDPWNCSEEDAALALQLVWNLVATDKGRGDG